MKFSIVTCLFLLTVSSLHAQSEYEDTFTIPNYDVGNPEHFLISSNQDWAYINDTGKRYFYVEPGSYATAGTDSGRVVLTTSGTESAKRYISLYNGNDTHPGELDRTQLAKVGFVFQDADYWVIDRMSYWDSTGGFEAMLVKNSTDNIVNRYLAEDVEGGTIVFMDGSDNNTFQNSRIERTNFEDFLDRGAIEINHRGVNFSEIKNTKVLNNEVVNVVDGFQAVKTGDASQLGINYEGTIVDSNIFYIDSTIYTDGNGNHNPNGSYAYAENAIDLKAGSENPNNPMVISNNKMWGYRQSDTTNSYLSDFGIAMVGHYDVKNLEVTDNLFWDSARGISVDGPRNGSAMEDAEFNGNIILDIKTYGIVLYDTDRITFSDNLMKEVGRDLGGFSFWGVINDGSDFQFNDNLMVQTEDLYGAAVRGGVTGVTVSNNAYYHSKPGELSHASDSILSSDPTSDYGDLVFITDRYTLNPRTITINNVLLSAVLEGDFDGDGDVDGADFLAWQRGELPGGATAEDLALWQTHFGTIYSSLAVARSVPEPSTLLLMLAGTVFWRGINRRRACQT